MIDEIRQAERVEGSAQIEELCREIARELGLNLEDVHWATDIVVAGGAGTSQNYILTIIADTGTIDLPLSRVEIEDFPGKVGTEKTVAKIRAALRDIL